MPQQPQVYLIHANDAPQHQGRLQEILQQLQAEQRSTRAIHLWFFLYFSSFLIYFYYDFKTSKTPAFSTTDSH